MGKALYRFLSRNETTSILPATEEERLFEVVLVLGDAYEYDLADAEAKAGAKGRKKFASVSDFPKFGQAVKQKAIEYKEVAGYRRLCSAPSFTHGLVMAARVKRHYTHAPWFKIQTLLEMLASHGAVSEGNVPDKDS